MVTGDFVGGDIEEFPLGGVEGEAQKHRVAFGSILNYFLTLGTDVADKPLEDLEHIEKFTEAVRMRNPRSFT